MKYVYRTLWVIFCCPLLIIITFVLGFSWLLLGTPILLGFYFIRDGNLNELPPDSPFNCIICKKYMELINKLTPK